MFSFLHKDQKGAAAIEFAIVLPVLAAILFGTIDFALALYNKQVLTNASRELARHAIIMSNWENQAEMEKQSDYIQQFCSERLVSLFGVIALENITPSVIEDPGDDTLIIASISYPHNYMFSALPFFPDQETGMISGKTTMRNEWKE